MVAAMNQIPAKCQRPFTTYSS